jgi:hypothetical protein
MSCLYLASPIALALSLVSCGPDYPRKITYELADSYSSAKSRLSSHYQSQASDFGLFSDRTDVSVQETRSGAECRFLYAKWAPDLGKYAAHGAILEKRNSGSRFEVVEMRPTRLLYDTPASLSGDRIGRLAPIDKWVTRNLQVRERQLGVETKHGPLSQAP